MYCGIDLHARTMDLCILDQAGETLLHRNMPATPEARRKAIAPSREQIVLAAEGLLTWDWLADLCAGHGIPCVLGHALSMQAIHGGKATNDKRDAHTIAGLLRGGMRPQADVSPAERRAPRDRLRRRRPLARKRGALLAHVHNTHSQYTLPALGTKIASKANRDGGAERFADPAVHKSIAVDLALITSYAALLRDVELPIVTPAKPQDAQTLSRLQTVPGIGTILSLVLLDAMHDLARFPRGQDCASSCRLVTCAREAAGKRSGTSGSTIGNAHLPWAFSEAAVFFLRDHPAAQPVRARFEKKHGTGTALTILAPPLARAVSDLLQRHTAFALDTCLHGEGRGVGARNAALDRHGMHGLRNARYGGHHGVAARS
ncbi:MAG TPA: transposase [Candidatus Saccharimonadia bacterium]|nr:transposase [Candidatus Saccharimonadia bacterium]